MREVNLKVEITFFEGAKESFNFPIINSIRTSFWLPDSKFSTFSELSFNEEKIEVKKKYQAEIVIIERDFLIGKLEIGSEFKVGTYPKVIAEGKIVAIMPKFESKPF